MIFPFGPPPEEDSADLTDEEVLAAIPTKSVDDVIAVTGTVDKRSSCAVCSKPKEPVQHALRRRIPHLYWRIRVACPEGHQELLVFQADWVGAR
jgi:hypothetical protein